MTTSVRRGIQSAQIGLLVNTLLAVIKLIAGIAGNAHALVADAVESSADVFSSLIVWGGLRIASRQADDDYPFGYGKAESLAAGVVALMLIGAAAGISVDAVREIRSPGHIPAPFTLAVLVAVIVVKAILSRWVYKVGEQVSSTAVKAEAWHHRTDALTSTAAFVGISVSLLGGPGWESADDWAALAAAAVIVANALLMLRPAVHDLMDRSPGGDLQDRIAAAALATPDVREVEKLKVRKAGLGYYVDIHVQANPRMSLRDAHNLSGRVKAAIRDAVPVVTGVLIHMEPYEP